MTREYIKRTTRQKLMIDGQEIDIKSSKVYKTTGIYDYIDYIIIKNADSRHRRADTKHELVAQCFCRSKLFKELLNKNCTFLLYDYDKEALEIVSEYCIARLNSMVMSEVKRLEKLGVITSSSYYIDNKKMVIDLSEEDEKLITEKALAESGCFNAYQACSNSSTSSKFLNIRNRLIYEKTGRKVVSKKFYINFDESISQSDYDDCISDYYIGSQESQIILTKFFDVFRTKLSFDLKEKMHTSSNHKLTKFSGGWEAIRIIEEYCAYMTTPSYSSTERPKAFYSLDELLLWQEEKNKAWSDEYDDTLYCGSSNINIYNINNFLDS